MSERIYSEAEVQALLRQAAERQKRLGPADVAHGLTLSGVEAIAAEAGLDPAHVRAAARSGPAEPSATLLGSPRAVRRSRYIDRPLTDEARIGIVGDLRRTCENDGTATQLGAVREWKSGARKERIQAHAGSGFRVTVSQRFEEQIRGLTGGGFWLLLTAVMITIGLIAGGDTAAWPAALTMLMGAAAFFVGPAFFFRQYGEKQARQFDAVLDRTEKAAPEARLAESERLAPPAARAALDLDALDLDALDEAPAREAAHVRRRDRA